LLPDLARKNVEVFFFIIFAVSIYSSP